MTNAQPKNSSLPATSSIRFRPRGLGNGCPPIRPAQGALEVVDEVPLGENQPVERPQVEMLEAMKAVARLGRGKAGKRQEVDVVVRAVDVRVGVMRDVVLAAPDVRAGPQYVERYPHQPVDGAVGRVGAVVGVMLDAEANAGHRERERDREQRALPEARRREDEQRVRNTEPDEQHRRLEVHAGAVTLR